MSDAFSVFAHLNVEKTDVYRRVLGVFVTARSRFVIAMRPAEVATKVGDATGAEEVEAALRQLKVWGNLDDAPDTSEAATLEEFYRDRRLYQLSAAGEAAEAALTVFDEYLHRPGELQTTALRDILELLDALPPLLATSETDDAKLHLTLSTLSRRFEELTARAQAFMRGLQRTVDLYGISVEAFLGYKERLIEYLEKFIGELVVATNRAAEALLGIQETDLARLFASVARRELSDALDPTPERMDAALNRCRDQWNGLRRWFVGEGDSMSQAELLRGRARAAIPALLSAVAQIHDRRASRVDRATDFLALARWFAEAPDDAAAHRLWRSAFALSSARHLRINAETLDARAKAKETAKTSWLDGIPMWISPRLRQSGRLVTRGVAPQTIDRTREKARLVAMAEAEAEALARVRDRFRGVGRRRLGDLGFLTRGEFRYFLDLMGRAYSQRDPETGVAEASSVDGTFRVRFEPIEHGERVTLETEEGDLTGMDHWVRVDATDAKGGGA